MKKFSFVALLSMSAAFLSCSPDEGVDRYIVSCGGGVAAKSYEYKNYKDLDPSCKSEEKKFFAVFDTNTVSPPGFGREPDTSFTNPEDARAWKEEQIKLYDEWVIEHKKRDLPISCVTFEGPNFWRAFLTDEEVTELVETYGVSYVSDIYVVDDGSSGCGCGCKIK
jgi:hypothetical protein